jgi:transposase
VVFPDLDGNQCEKHRWAHRLSKKPKNAVQAAACKELNRALARESSRPISAKPDISCQDLTNKEKYSRISRIQKKPRMDWEHGRIDSLGNPRQIDNFRRVASLSDDATTRWIMGRRVFTREFKLEAVKLVKERGVSVSQVAKDLDIGPSVVGRWVRESSTDKAHAFPGRGQMKPDDAEIARLKRELAKTKAERDILKKTIGFFVKDPT